MIGPAPGWAAQQLAEYLAAVGETANRAAALLAGVELAAEALDAEVAAIMAQETLVSAIGFPSGQFPHKAMRRVIDCRAGELDVPGVGLCPAVAVEIAGTTSMHLLVARSGAPLDPEEQSLLRGMARGLSLILKGLDLLDNERTVRARSQQQAAENAALLARLQERQSLLERLSKIQRSISHRKPLQEVLDAVVVGAGELLGDEVTGLRLLDGDDPSYMLLMAHRGIEPAMLPGLLRVPVGEGEVGVGVGGRAIREDCLVTIEDYAEAAGTIEAFRARHLQVAMAAPVRDHGRVVGSLTVATYRSRPPYSHDEQEVLLAFAEHASMAITDARTVAQMQHQAFHDALTGLPNRALLLDRLEQALARTRREVGGRVAVLFIDLDGFKYVNDSLGHTEGDRLLVDVAARIRGCLRASDTAARLGGDEFAVLVEDSDDDEDATQVADRILAAVGAPFEISGKQLHVTASIGVASSTLGEEAAAELLRNADLAMYNAKGSGKHRSRVYREEMHETAMRRLHMEADLRQAIEREEFAVHYQPIIQLQTGQLSGVEALVRWIHPQHGVIMPADFIAVAEETGQVAGIGQKVLAMAAKQLRQWQLAFPRLLPLTLSVNLSGIQLLRPELSNEVRRVLESTAIPPETLCLEITETVLMGDTDATLTRLHELKALGLRIAVDDFGTGYSSLRYLRSFPIDVIKIDRSFVDGIAGSFEDAAVARAVINLGQTLRLETIAEGIETLDQVRELKALGCLMGQGYHFSRPLSADAVSRMLAEDPT
ncbi:MAG: putative bifunctional diguanylate cyclase/phosphodiesterase, partial [Candidatus Dormibacteria bacterium]